MNRYIANIKQLAYILAIPLLKALYLVVNRIERPAANIAIWLDSYIPVVPIWVIPYMLFYPFVFCGLLYLFVHERSRYMQVVLGYSVGLIVCYATYLCFQTTMPRPTLTGTDIFTQMLKYLYSIDRPVNCLPSIHVLGSIIIMLGVKDSGTPAARYAVPLGALIIASTLFTKQHGVLDVISGLGLGTAVYYLAQPSRFSPLLRIEKSGVELYTQRVPNSN